MVKISQSGMTHGLWPFFNLFHILKIEITDDLGTKTELTEAITIS